MNPIIILGGKKRGALLLKFALINGIKVKGVSPTHLYPQEQGENDEFLKVAEENQINIFDGNIFSGLFTDKFPCEALVICENWRRIISREWMEKTKGVWVFHESLLPKYRGFAPIAWQILNNEKYFGVTLFKASEEMDAGDIVAQKSIPLKSSDTSFTLYKKTLQMYKELLMEGLENFEKGINTVPQNEKEATYTVPLLPDDGKICWSDSVENIIKKVRAFTKPYSGAWCFYKSKKLFMWSAERSQFSDIITGRVPGRVVQSPYGNEINCVCAGDGVVLIKEASLEGENPSKWFFDSHKATLY